MLLPITVVCGTKQGNVKELRKVWYVRLMEVKGSKKPFSPSLTPTQAEPCLGTYLLLGPHYLLQWSEQSTDYDLSSTLSCSVNICREMDTWCQCKIIYFYLVGVGKAEVKPMDRWRKPVSHRKKLLAPQSQIDSRVPQTGLDWQYTRGFRQVGRVESLPPPYPHPDTSLKKKKAFEAVTGIAHTRKNWEFPSRYK